MGAANFWSDSESAQAVVQQLKLVKATLEPYFNVESLREDAEVLVELADEDGSDDAISEATHAVQALALGCERLEMALMLGGPHDHRNAYLTIQAGAGGTEACDWAEMVLRMYLRFCEESDEFEADLIERQDHDEAGIKSATLLVKGQFAFGYLQSETGAHRLVRISPFDAQNRRQTSFCAVGVTPEFDEDLEVEIKDDDLRIDTYRAGGAGGQHINKTDSAVRITHIPSGIVVQCQNERSQHKNRSTAMKMLNARLFAIEEQKRAAEIEGLQGEKGDIGWGHQIRSYVLQPYTMVKDLRTAAEKGNAQAVLDGDIDVFIQAYLRWVAAGRPEVKGVKGGTE